MHGENTMCRRRWWGGWPMERLALGYCLGVMGVVGVARAAEAQAGVPVGGGLKVDPLEPRQGGAGPLFTAVPAAVSGVDFQMSWGDLDLYLKEMLRMNPSGGICTGDINGDGLPDFYVTSPSGGGRLYRNRGGFQFTDATQEAGLGTDFWGTGASMVDLNNDGHLDLFVCCYRQPNRAYINDGTGRFSDRAAALHLGFSGGSMTMGWADTDADGDLDGYLATTGTAPPPTAKFRVKMVPRAGDGKEVPVVVPEVEEYWQILILPGDRAMRIDSAQHDRVFRQDVGKFSDVTAASGVKGPYFTLSVTAWDYDADQRPDWYVANDFSGPDRLLRNRGDGTFDDRLLQAVPHTPWFSMGSDTGDLNNDGLIDLFATDMSATTHYREKVMMGNMDTMSWFLDWAEPRQFMRNAVYLNTGTGRMLQAAQLLGVSSTDWTWTPRLEDFDNDGWLDLFITNGIMRDAMHSDMTDYADNVLKPGTPEFVKFWKEQPMRKEKNAAFRNTGALKFENVGAAWGLDREGVSFGAATADFDNDGDLDLVVSNADVPASVYQNNSVAGHVAKVRLTGTSSNRWGLGATVRVRLPDGQRLTRYVTATRGYLSASDPVVHFGLGEQSMIAELTVEWPSGRWQSFKDLPADRFFHITEAGAAVEAKKAGAPALASPPATAAAATPLFSRSGGLGGWQHRERVFDDFEREPLLPNKQSHQGPGLAWGDVDGDGDDDVFLGGARGQSGSLAINAGGGQFSLREVPAFAAHAASEDMGAVWIDVESDGDLDLYVVSGGSETAPDDASLQDRIYLNDGRGGLTDAPAGTLPAETASGSAVAAADIDLDGDIDLFVGGRAVPGQYPRPSPSFLLVNAGGKFTSTPLDCGVVNAAQWANLDSRDGPELVLACEWGSLRTYAVRDSGLAETTADTGLGQWIGWWNGVAVVDVDHDGDADLAATNFGLNTKYKATSERPEMMYYGVFDETDRVQIVEAKFEGNSLLPRRGLSCSSKAMPFIKDKLKSFHTFAAASLGDVYTEEKLRKATRLEVNTLESGVFINAGGKFTFRPFGRLAQMAPSFGVAAGDFDGDGHPDVVMAQNFYHPQRETGRMNGGLGVFLKGDGRGGFDPLWPRASGLVESGDARSVAVTDVNGYGAPDLVMSINDAAPSVWLHRGGDFLGVRLTGPRGNPTGLGAVISVQGGAGSPSVLEVAGGGGYLTQHGSTHFFPASASSARVTVRWPDGVVTTATGQPGQLLNIVHGK